MLFSFQGLRVRQPAQPPDPGPDRAAAVEGGGAEPRGRRPPVPGHGQRHLPEVRRPTV
ncbi:hypothetical protein EYF80_068281 [Liparis tanakae]|uniref:Uncharacterized protein n=1 Tax=Liparis tanakae TaxID=230148 RepID=A0A4Z2DYU2_9TELE|nr:hypothetical protein EYF80_068281 [Liparis tanakae]